MESSYPRGSNNNHSASRRHKAPSSGSSRRGTADRPLSAEDEYIRSLRKRQVEREQALATQGTTTSSSSIYDRGDLRGSSNRRSTTGSSQYYNTHGNSSARRSSNSSSLRKADTESSADQPFSSSRRTSSSSSPLQDPSYRHKSSSGQFGNGSSYSRNDKGRRTSSSGSHTLTLNSSQATTSPTGPVHTSLNHRMSGVFLSGISSSSRDTSAANDSSGTRVIEMDGQRYAVTSSSSGKRSPRTSLGDLNSAKDSSVTMPRRQLRTASESDSHQRQLLLDSHESAVARQQIPTSEQNREVAQSTIDSLPNSHFTSSSAKTTTALEVGGSASASADVRALRAQRLRETAVQRRNSGNSAVMAAVAAMEEKQLRQQGLGSKMVPSSPSNKLSRQIPNTAVSPSLGSLVNKNPDSNSPGKVVTSETAGLTDASTSSLASPSTIAAASAVPGVDKFLQQRRTSVSAQNNASSTVPKVSVRSNTDAGAVSFPLPGAAGRSKTEPGTAPTSHGSGNSLMSSLLSRDSAKSFDSESSSDEDDHETLSCCADDSSSDEDDTELLQDYSVRVSIVSVVDLPANVVPNLPLSPVLRVGLVRVAPSTEDRLLAGEEHATKSREDPHQDSTKLVLSKMLSGGLLSIPKAKVRTTTAKILSKRDNGSVEFNEEMRWDRVRRPEQMAVAIELSSRAVMTPRNIKESPPPPKTQIPVLNSTASLGRNSLTRQRQVEAAAETSTRGNLSALGSLFKRPVRKEKEIETATAAAAVAHMLVEPGDGESRLSSLRPLNQSELYVKLRPRKRRKKMKMTEDLQIASQLIPLTKLPLRKALLGMDSARIEKWVELDVSSTPSVATIGANASLANKRRPSVLLEITFCTSERLDESEDDMDEEDNVESHLRASYAKRQSLKIRSQLKEELARREAKHQVKEEPELVPGVIDYVCVVGARDIGDQKFDDGSTGWVNSNPECCILERFPPDDSLHINNGRLATLPEKVEWFCFPESCRLWRGTTPPNLDELNLQRFSASSPANIATSIASFDACLGCTTSFTWFVLSSNSDEYGSDCAKTYGAAIRFYVPAPRGIDPTQDDFAQAITDTEATDDFDLPGGRRLWVPMAVMITSRLPIIGTMEVMLLRMCEVLGNLGIPGEYSGVRHTLHQELASLIVLYQRPIPGVVHCSIPFLAGDRFHIALPPVGGLPALPHGNSVASVCRLLGSDGLNFLLAAFLTECKILLHSTDMANICLVAEVMTALIYPFTWTLPYVPVLPVEMMELIEAPLSYLIGVPSCNMKYIDPRQLEDVIVVDLDKDFSPSDYQNGKIDGSKMKSSAPLPASVASNISKAVYRLLRSEEDNEDDLPLPKQRSFPRLEAESAAEREFRVSVAIEICGLLRGFQDCLVCASSSQPIFNVDRFLQIAPAMFEEQRGTSTLGPQETTQVLSPRSRRFMSLLVNCQHFHQFLETLDSEHTLFFREIMSTVHTNNTTHRVGRAGQLTLDFQNMHSSLCLFLQRLEDKVPTYRVNAVFTETTKALDQNQIIPWGSRWPRDLLQRISAVNDSMSIAGSIDHSDGGIKQISVEYLVELEKNPWRYQNLFDISSELFATEPFASVSRTVKLKEAIGERRYQAWKLALEQEKFDLDEAHTVTTDSGSKSASSLDLNTLVTSTADECAPLSANPWEDGFTRSKLESAQQRLQDAKDRDVLRRCFENALLKKGVLAKGSQAERDLVSESEVSLRNPAARKFLLDVLSKRTRDSSDSTSEKQRASTTGASKLEASAFSVLLQLGCAFLDACIEANDYTSAYNLLKLSAGIYTIYGEKDHMAVSYMTSRLGMHPFFADMGVWEKAKDLHVRARKENKANDGTNEQPEELSDDEDEYDAAVATLYEMLGYGIPSEELARFATRVNEINGWHNSERGQSLLMLARRLSVRREHGTGGNSPEKKSDLDLITSNSSSVPRPAVRSDTETNDMLATRTEQSIEQNICDVGLDWLEISWCHPAAQSSRRMNTGSTPDIRRPGGTSSLLSMLDETKINTESAKQTAKHMKRSAVTTMAFLGSSVVVTGGIDGGVFLARKAMPSSESSHVPDGYEKNSVYGVHLDWGSSGSRYTTGSTANTLDGEYGVGAVTCLATTCGGSSYTFKEISNRKGTLDTENIMDEEDLLAAMDSRRVVAGTTCGDLRVWSIKDVFSSVFYSNQTSTMSFTSINFSHASGAASSRLAGARRTGATDFAAGTSLTRLKFSLRGRALSGHRGGVSCIDVPSTIYRPDSIVSGGADGLIKLWNLRSPGAASTRVEQTVSLGVDDAAMKGKAAGSGDALSILSGHAGRILCLKTAWHGDRLLSGGADRTVRVWDLAGSGGKCLHSLSGHYGWVSHVQYWGPNTIISASTDRSVGLWDARVRNTPLFMLRHHYAPISDLLVGSRTDPIMISSASDGSVAAWDFRYLSSQDDISTSTPRKQSRLCTNVRDPDGRLFMQDYCRHTRITGPVLLSRGPSRSRRTVLCLGADNIIREWDFQTGDVVSEHVTGHCDLISSFHALQGNKTFDSQLSTGPMTGTITTSWDGTIRMRKLIDKASGAQKCMSVW